MSVLYKHYQVNPLDMLSPEELHADEAFSREDLLWNVHYLNDRGLAEMMIRYNPTAFDGVRITPAGVELIENKRKFDLQFPPILSEAEKVHADIPVLIERLIEESELSFLNGEKRKSLLRDVQYLRDEVARPAQHWRQEVIESVLGWISGYHTAADEELPSLTELRKRIGEKTDWNLS